MFCKEERAGSKIGPGDSLARNHGAFCKAVSLDLPAPAAPFHGVWLGTIDGDEYALHFRKDGHCDVSGPEFLFVNGINYKNQPELKDLSIRYVVGMSGEDDFLLIVQQAGNDPMIEEIPVTFEFLSEDRIVIRGNSENPDKSLFSKGLGSLVSFQDVDVVLLRREDHRPRDVLKAYRDYHMGREAMSESFYHLAISHLDDAIAHWPTYGSAHTQRAIAQWKLGEIQQALADIRFSLSINPSDVSIQAVRVYAEILEDSGDIQKSASVLQRAADLESVTWWDLNSIAWAQIAIGDYERAMQNADRLTAVEEEASFYNTRAWARFYSGDIDGAGRDGRKALELDMRNVLSRILVYRITESSEGEEIAVEALRSYCSSLPDGADIEHRILLDYYLGEVSMDDLRRHPDWSTLRSAVRPE